MPTFYNQKPRAAYPTKPNKREARQSTTNNSLAEYDADHTIPADDNTDFWNCTTTADTTLTLPPAVNSKGRTITVRMTQIPAAAGAAVAAAAGDTREDSPATLPLGLNEWTTWFCTGSEWKVVKSS